MFLPALLDRESDERNVRVRRLRCVEIAPPLSENEIKGLRRVKTPMSETRFLFIFLRFEVNKIERNLIQGKN